MTPDLIATYIPCLWCGAVQVWFCKSSTLQVTSAGRSCNCRERHEVMVGAGRERFDVRQHLTLRRGVFGRER